jgi:hypothetical protein
MKKLRKGVGKKNSEKLETLKDRLVEIQNTGLKINHSVMELVCARHLIEYGFDVGVEQLLDGDLICDLYGTKGSGIVIVEIETGFVPPEGGLEPNAYLRSRIASKIARYSGFADEFILASPSYYTLQISPTLIKPTHARTKAEIAHIKRLCDLHYSNPPVSPHEIRNACLHFVYVMDIDNATIKEYEPENYISRNF